MEFFPEIRVVTEKITYAIGSSVTVTRFSTEEEDEGDSKGLVLAVQK
jgi:hypothetical protein